MMLRIAMSSFLLASSMPSSLRAANPVPSGAPVRPSQPIGTVGLVKHPSLAIRIFTDKVAYVPGADQNVAIGIRLVNKDLEAKSVGFEATISQACGLSVPTPFSVTSHSVDVPAAKIEYTNEYREWAIVEIPNVATWPVPQNIEWGCEFLLEVKNISVVAGTPQASGAAPWQDADRQVVVISNDPLMTAANYESFGPDGYEAQLVDSNFNDWVSLERMLSFYQEECAVPLLERFSWMPNGWGNSDPAAIVAEADDPTIKPLDKSWKQPCNFGKDPKPEKSTKGEFAYLPDVDVWSPHGDETLAWHENQRTEITVVQGCQLKAETQLAHARGMKVISYVRTSLNRWLGWNWAVAHPDNVRYDNAQGAIALNASATEAKCSSYTESDACMHFFGHGQLAHFEPDDNAEITAGLNEWLDAIQSYGFDGIRYDATIHTANDVSVIGVSGPTWQKFRRDQGAVLPIIPKEQESDSLAILAHIHDVYDQRYPQGLLAGSNAQAANSHHPTSPFLSPPRQSPRSHDEFLRGRLWLDEKHYASASGGMSSTWSNGIAQRRYGNEMAKALGSFHYTGAAPSLGATDDTDPKIESPKNSAFLRATLSMGYASGARGVQACQLLRSASLMRYKREIHGRTTGFHPAWHRDLVTFSQRFAKYLFHPSLVSLAHEDYEMEYQTATSAGALEIETLPLPAKADLARIAKVALQDAGCPVSDDPSVCTTPTETKVAWKPFQYQLAIDGKLYLIVHLWSRPGPDEANMDAATSGTKRPRLTNARVTAMGPSGKAPIATYALSPEYAFDGSKGWLRPLGASNKVAVPAFEQWTMVIFEY